MKLFCLTFLLATPTFAAENSSASILVSAFADSEFNRFEVIFSKLEVPSKEDESSPGADVKVVTYKADESIFEEKSFNFSEFTSALPCSNAKGSGKKCKPLSKRAIVSLKFDSTISNIKLFYKDKEIKSARVPKGLLKIKSSNSESGRKSRG